MKTFFIFFGRQYVGELSAVSLADAELMAAELHGPLVKVEDRRIDWRRAA
jgi:hypothetical protein